jgi:uncharacterized protein YggE
MAEIGKFKLSDAITQLLRKVAGKKGGKPMPSHETTAEQIRETRESKEARNDQASIRDRMVDIGRGNQQAGRQGQWTLPPGRDASSDEWAAATGETSLLEIAAGFPGTGASVMNGIEEPTTRLSGPSDAERESECMIPRAAGEKPGRRTISVSGHGKISAPPDLADIGIGVITQASTAREALTANSGQMTAMQAVLKEHGVAAKDIQSTSISVQPQYSQPPPLRPGQSQHEFEPKIIGYQVQHMVRITARDLASLGALLDATVEAGANQMHGISFRIREVDALLDAARKKAMADARKKAELLADEARLVVGPPIAIRDDASPYPSLPPMGGFRTMAAPSLSVPVAAGEQELGATVHVLYELKTPKRLWRAGKIGRRTRRPPRGA